jgi:hypothetical protein
VEVRVLSWAPIQKFDFDSASLFPEKSRYRKTELQGAPINFGCGNSVGWQGGKCKAIKGGGATPSALAAWVRRCANRG